MSATVTVLQAHGTPEGLFTWPVLTIRVRNVLHFIYLISKAQYRRILKSLPDFGVDRTVTMTNIDETVVSVYRVSLKVSVHILQVFHMPTVDDSADIDPIIQLLPYTTNIWWSIPAIACWILCHSSAKFRGRNYKWKLGNMLFPLIQVFLPCLPWLLFYRTMKLRRDFWLALHLLKSRIKKSPF